MIGKDIHKAADLLKREEVVAIPTETVYGLAGNAFSEKAVSTIFSVKNRPHFDPLILHTYSIEKAKEYVNYFPQKAERLAKKFWAGSLTLLLPKKDVIPDIVTSGLPHVAIRIPRHEYTLRLLRLLDFPLAAPSANPFGYVSPTSAQHVEKQLGTKIPYILDGGSCVVGVESTIVGFEDEMPVIYRKGGIAVEEIESCIGQVKIQEHSSSNPHAPGMLKSHYATHAPLLLGNIETYLPTYIQQKVGILSFCRTFENVPLENQFILSPTQDYAEAARNLFSYMRLLDEKKFDVILAELLPEENLGRAINDRLKRAAAPRNLH